MCRGHDGRYAGTHNLLSFLNVYLIAVSLPSKYHLASKVSLVLNYVRSLS